MEFKSIFLFNIFNTNCISYFLLLFKDLMKHDLTVIRKIVENIAEVQSMEAKQSNSPISRLPDAREL